MRTGILALAALAAVGLSGCSRKQINYQVSRCIGTDGVYENNEPVETPKMKANRELKEQEDQEEKKLTDVLAQAENLAKGYFFDKAIALLENAEIDAEDARVTEAIETYQKGMENVYQYEGAIPHLSFPNLIADTRRAFEESGNRSGYASVMLTCSEFEKILEEMYRKGYILIDIHSLMGASQDGSMASLNPTVPKGKKPFILSVENLDYSQVLRNGDGIATKLVQDDSGAVKALYTDPEGHDLKGDYDVIPLLEKFIASHPDFSYQGARGIIGIAGKNGVFGYKVEDDGYTNYEENRQTVKNIAEKLKKDGWNIACETYGYQYLKDISYNEMVSDIDHWKEAVGTLIGATDILICPYGSEIQYSGDKFDYLSGLGFRYYISLWATDDFREVYGNYMRQTRRMVNGYVFDHSPHVFDEYFDVSSIWDSDRNS